MPELPEVEIAVRNVRRSVAGARLRALEICDDRLVVEGGSLVDTLVGGVVEDVARRAKHAVMVVGELAMVWHFRMTGNLVQAQAGDRARARLSFDNGAGLSFTDTRRLGTLTVLRRDDLLAYFDARGIGPEPWPGPRSGSFWRERLVGSRSAVKVAMMDQARVAGIGNILASEVLHRSNVHPWATPHTLEDADWEAIAAACEAVIDEVVAAEDGREITYVNNGGDIDETTFRVYGRAGRPCLTCGSPIERGRQAGRSTFWCATCQPHHGQRR